MAKVASKFANGNSGSNSRRLEFDCTLKNHFKTQSNKKMNAKQTIPVIAKIAPPLLFGVAIYYGLKWLLSADGAKKKPAVIPPPSVKIPSPAPMPTAVAIPKIVAQAPPPPPIKRKFVTREDMATAFHCGARTLTRTTAVAALKNLGFGKTAAYEALLEDGRFASLLQCASDGIITWKG